MYILRCIQTRKHEEMSMWGKILHSSSMEVPIGFMEIKQIKV